MSGARAFKLDLKKFAVTFLPRELHVIVCVSWCWQVPLYDMSQPGCPSNPVFPQIKIN